jgi:F-type H+-transporting ATPase subunit delta
VEEIAQVYARSLFEVAKESDKLDVVHEQLDEFTDVLSENRDLQVFFFSPYFSTQEKVDGLHTALEDADETLVNFLELLIEKHRMPALMRIRREFDSLWEEENRRLPVSVTSAIELEESTVKQIGDAISEQTGQHIDLQTNVDPDILGGIVLRVGNSVLDASIRNRLEKLRKQVVKA